MAPREAAGGVVQAPTDEELVLALARGHTDSLGSLVARWEQPLFRFVYRLLERREDARDVCQETFLRVLRGASDFREGARFSTWMYQIALNLCRDQVRRRTRWRLRLVEPPPRDDDAAAPRSEPVSADALPDDVLDAERRERAVHEALRELPPEQREVVFLKEFEGLKFREIADVLGCPESTVKSRMYFALDSMRRTLSRRGLAS
jgi:RNA polymerase sigma-70 factor (ECF subfamily)